jgi:hypothetical protein
LTIQAEEIEPEVSYRMALPAPWVRFPMEPTAMRSAVRAWLLRKYAHRSRDETAQLRRHIENQMVELANRSGSQYSRQMLVLSIDVDGFPVSASCLVSVIPQDLHGPNALEDLARDLSAGARSSAVEELGRSLGVVVVRDEVMAGSRGDKTNRELLTLGAEAMEAIRPGTPVEARELDDDELEQVVRDAEQNRVVDVFIPVPDQPRCLLLNFSTPLVPLFDALTTLFVTVASTVQWRVGDDTWK